MRRRLRAFLSDVTARLCFAIAGVLAAGGASIALRGGPFTTYGWLAFGGFWLVAIGFLTAGWLALRRRRRASRVVLGVTNLAVAATLILWLGYLGMFFAVLPLLTTVELALGGDTEAWKHDVEAEWAARAE